METLKHFLFGIAKLSADWKLENILEEELEKLRRQVSIGHQASWLACVMINLLAAAQLQQLQLHSDLCTANTYGRCWTSAYYQGSTIPVMSCKGTARLCAFSP